MGEEIWPQRRVEEGQGEGGGTHVLEPGPPGLDSAIPDRSSVTQGGSLDVSEPMVS